MHISDYWALVESLSAEGQDTSLLRIVGWGVERFGLKTVDEAFAQFNSDCERFAQKHGRELFTSPAGQTLRIVALNAVPQSTRASVESGDDPGLAARQRRNLEKLRHRHEYSSHGRIK